MHHGTSHRPGQPALRWGFVIRATLAVCAVFLIAFAAWYATVIALPAYRNAEQDRAFESAELQLLTIRLVDIERFVHLPANP